MSGMGAKGSIEAYRAGAGVTRYHTMIGHHPERVGQHSAEVAAICMILDPLCSKVVLMEALMHDIGEFSTGDIPANVKKRLPAEFSTQLELLEDEYVENIVELDEITVDEYQLIKTADALQLCFYALHEVKGGNRHYRIVFERGIEYLRQVNWPHAVAAQVEEIIHQLEEDYSECK